MVVEERVLVLEVVDGLVVILIMIDDQGRGSSIIISLGEWISQRPHHLNKLLDKPFHRVVV